MLLLKEVAKDKVIFYCCVESGKFHQFSPKFVLLRLSKADLSELLCR